MTNDIKEQILQRILRAREELVVPGGVFGWIDGAESEVIPVGSDSYELSEFVQRWELNPPLDDADSKSVFEQYSARAFQDDSIFDCASVTKSFPLALIVLRLISKGILKLNDKVSDFIKGCSLDVGSCTVWNVMTHTVDFRFSLGEVARNNGDVLKSILWREFQDKPGELYCYSNSSSLLLTLVLEELTQKSFDELAIAEVFEPLQLQNVSFSNEQAHPVEYCPWRESVIKGKVHDESAYSLLPKHQGAAGLFASVPEMLKILRGLDQCFHGESNYLPQDVVRQLIDNQIPKLGSTSLGMELNESRFMGDVINQHPTLGKTGFTGCHWLWTPHLSKAFVFFSNYPWPRRLQSPDKLNALRKDLSDIFYGNSI